MRIGCCYHPRLTTGCGKFHFVADAFRALGHSVTHVQTLAELRDADSNCEVIVHEQRGPASLNLVDAAAFLGNRQAVHCQWFFDLNVMDHLLTMELQPGLEPYLKFTRSMDIVFVKERDRLDDYKAIGINAVWLDQACPSSMEHAAFDEDPEFDVILWGSSRREIWRQRYEDVQSLVDAGYRVAWATTEPHLPNGVTRIPGCQPLELPRLVSMAKITLCVDAAQSIEGYWSDRVWLAAGAGACILRRASKGGEGLPAVHYNSQLSLLNTMQQLCDDSILRERVGQMAREVTMSANTYECRCQEILSNVDSYRNERSKTDDVSSLQGDEETQTQRQDTAMSGVY